MFAYIWKPQFDQGGDIRPREKSWEERWWVHGYIPTGNPAWLDLQFDRPDLAPGSYHPIVAGATVDSFRCERAGTSASWEVTINYKVVSENVEDEDSEWDIPPTQRAARITLSSERFEIQTYKVFNDDGDEEWLLNSVGDLIYDQTRPASFLNFNITKSVSAVPLMILQYLDSVNSDTVSLKGLTFDPGYLLFQDLNVGDVQTEVVGQVTYRYMDMSFVLKYNPLGWRQEIMNRGLRCKNEIWYPNNEGNIGPCRSGDEDSTEPMFLNSAGGQIADNISTEAKMNAINDALIKKWVHRRGPFNLLPLE